MLLIFYQNSLKGKKMVKKKRKEKKLSKLLRAIHTTHQGKAAFEIR